MTSTTDFTAELRAEEEVDRGKTADLEQARRWATELEAQLALATAFTIPKASGLGHILLERECAATDKWAVTNGGLGHGVWVNNRWQHIPAISLHDAFPYQLHEALEIGHRLANGSPS